MSRDRAFLAIVISCVVIILAVSGALPVRAEDSRIKGRQWEVTSSNLDMPPTSRAIVGGDRYLSPEIQLEPGINAASVDWSVTSTGPSVSVSGTILYGVESGRCTTWTDVSGGSYTTNIPINASGAGGSPIHPHPARFIRVQLVNNNTPTVTFTYFGLSTH